MENIKHSDRGRVCWFFLSKCDLTVYMKVIKWPGNMERGQNADLDFSDIFEKLLNKVETRCRSRLKCL